MVVIKMITAIRRRPGMTRTEFLDYHFQVHGQLSDAVKDPDEKPVKYIQTHIFDSAFPARADGPPNANWWWVNRDDVVELYFRDPQHISSVFGSEYVRSKIGPDGKNFNDFESAINLMAIEKSITINTRLASQTADVAFGEADATVAILFLASADKSQDGAELERNTTPLMITALESHASDDASGLIVGIGISPEFDLRKYFGGANMPVYALVYKVLLKDRSSIPAFRTAQSELYSKMADKVDQSFSFVVFGKEGLVCDVSKGIRFDPQRQPVLQI